MAADLLKPLYSLFLASVFSPDKSHQVIVSAIIVVDQVGLYFENLYRRLPIIENTWPVRAML